MWWISVCLGSRVDLHLSWQWRVFLCVAPWEVLGGVYDSVGNGEVACV